MRAGVVLAVEPGGGGLSIGWLLMLSRWLNPLLMAKARRLHRGCSTI